MNKRDCMQPVLRRFDKSLCERSSRKISCTTFNSRRIKFSVCTVWIESARFILSWLCFLAWSITLRGPQLQNCNWKMATSGTAPATLIKTKPRIENNRVLVTGGAGFVGSHLCEFLVNRGDYVSAGLADKGAEAEPQSEPALSHGQQQGGAAEPVPHYLGDLLGQLLYRQQGEHSASDRQAQFRGYTARCGRAHHA